MSIETEAYVRDELLSIATEIGVTGRHDMTKDELGEALQESFTDGFFGDAELVRPGDTVETNHLSGDLTVTELRYFGGNAVHRQVREDSDADSETRMLQNEVPGRLEIIMETVRGGRHKLVCHKDAPYGKNGDSAHLERWRAGDKEWMNNSDDPTFVRIVDSEPEFTEEESDE